MDDNQQQKIHINIKLHLQTEQTKAGKFFLWTLFTVDNSWSGRGFWERKKYRKSIEVSDRYLKYGNERAR